MTKRRMQRIKLTSQLSWLLNSSKPWQHHEFGGVRWDNDDNYFLEHRSWRIAARKYQHRTDLIRRLAGRLARSLCRLGPGVHASSIRIPGFVFGTPEKVAAWLFIQREERFEPVHHSTERAVMDYLRWSDDERIWMAYADGRFIIPGNATDRETLQNLAYEVRDTETCKAIGAA